MRNLNEADQPGDRYRKAKDWAKFISEKMSDEEFTQFVNYLESHNLDEFWEACEAELQRKIPGIDR